LKGVGASPSSNRYEILSHGDNVPTSEIVGIPLYNVGTSLEFLIMDENHDFASSLKVERNIPELEEDIPQYSLPSIGNDLAQYSVFP
jgi:hypothetical protein